MSAIMVKKSVDEISTIIASTSPQNRRNTEASLLPFDDGRLLVAWSDFYGSHSADEGPSRISARWSPDQGQTWGAPFVLQENIGRLNCMSASLLRLQSGRVLLAFGRKDGQPGLPGPAILHGMVKWSDDDCKTWSDPIDITRGDKYWCITNDRLVQLASGRILYPVEGRPGNTTAVWYSDDNGASWEMSRKNIEPPAPFVYDEPAVVELSSGKVAMYVRGEMGNLHIALSDDGGESWRPHKTHATDMAGHPHAGPNSANAPCIIKRIPETGDLLLVWNNNRARTPLTAAISSDDGETWRNIRDLEAMDGWPPKTLHTYASLAFLHGNVHLTYGHVQLNWQNKDSDLQLDVLASLKYRRLPVEWFY